MLERVWRRRRLADSFPPRFENKRCRRDAGATKLPFSAAREVTTSRLFVLRGLHAGMTVPPITVEQFLPNEKRNSQPEQGIAELVGKKTPSTVAHPNSETTRQPCWWPRRRRYPTRPGAPMRWSVPWPQPDVLKQRVAGQQHPLHSLPSPSPAGTSELHRMAHFESRPPNYAEANSCLKLGIPTRIRTRGWPLLRSLAQPPWNRLR